MVYLLGDGEERENLTQYIEAHGLTQHVKILGFIDNPYPYIKNSVATVLTSLSEGFSLALVESVMLHTPIISTDVGVAKELIDKYDCGSLIPYDEDALASVLIQYLNQYDGYRESFSIGEEYDWKTETEKTVALIKTAMAAKEQNTKIKKLPYPEVTIHDYELDTYQIEREQMYVLRVIKDRVPYEFLIHRRNENDKLIVFHNGAIPGGDVKVPVFQRHSWAKQLKTSAVFCMDPTIYLNGFLQLGWGIGKNENHYLKNSCKILKKIIAKMGIALEDTVIYGTSAGGFLSLMSGIFLRGAKVVADNAQLDARNWIYKEALDSIISFAFDNISDALRYPEQFSVPDAFEKHGYVPKIYLHVNLCSRADNTAQLVPFLKRAENLRDIGEYNDIEVILHYEPEKGHDGLSMDDAISFLYRVLALPESNF